MRQKDWPSAKTRMAVMPSSLLILSALLLATCTGATASGIEAKPRMTDATKTTLQATRRSTPSATSRQPEHTRPIDTQSPTHELLRTPPGCCAGSVPTNDGLQSSPEIPAGDPRRPPDPETGCGTGLQIDEYWDEDGIGWIHVCGPRDTASAPLMLALISDSMGTLPGLTEGVDYLGRETCSHGLPRKIALDLAQSLRRAVLLHVFAYPGAGIRFPRAKEAVNAVAAQSGTTDVIFSFGTNDSKLINYGTIDIGEFKRHYQSHIGSLVQSGHVMRIYLLEPPQGVKNDERYYDPETIRTVINPALGELAFDNASNAVEVVVLFTPQSVVNEEEMIDPELNYCHPNPQAVDKYGQNTAAQIARTIGGRLH